MVYDYNCFAAYSCKAVAFLSECSHDTHLKDHQSMVTHVYLSKETSMEF